jgi:hypothetical protein
VVVVVRVVVEVSVVVDTVVLELSLADVSVLDVREVVDSDDVVFVVVLEVPEADVIEIEERLELEDVPVVDDRVDVPVVLCGVVLLVALKLVVDDSVDVVRPSQMPSQYSYACITSWS